jgi:hypothetical protein
VIRSKLIFVALMMVPITTVSGITKPMTIAESGGRIGGSIGGGGSISSIPHTVSVTQSGGGVTDLSDGGGGVGQGSGVFGDWGGISYGGGSQSVGAVSQGSAGGHDGRSADVAGSGDGHHGGEGEELEMRGFIGETAAVSCL